jgi:hypothetical protein
MNGDGIKSLSREQIEFDQLSSIKTAIASHDCVIFI